MQGVGRGYLPSDDLGVGRVVDIEEVHARAGGSQLVEVLVQLEDL